MSKFKLFLTILFLSLIGVGSVWGTDPTIIYSENFGSNATSSTIAWKDASTYLSDANSRTYCAATNWKITKNTSVVCGLTGTSGLSHLFTQTANDKFVLIFGDLSGYTNVTLTVNWKNGASTKNNRTLTIKASSDGGSNYGSDLIGTNKSQDWQTLTYDVPASLLTNFAIEFTNTASNDSRIDDIKLVGIATSGPTKTTVYSSQNPPIYPHMLYRLFVKLIAQRILFHSYQYFKDQFTLIRVGRNLYFVFFNFTLIYRFIS